MQPGRVETSTGGQERCVAVGPYSPTMRIFALATVVGAVSLAASSGSETQSGPPAHQAQRADRPGPIPKPGPFAQPRSWDQVGLPRDQTRALIPGDNPQSAEKIALGEKLFFDGRLSADGTVACATCHDPERAFTDGRPASVGIHGRVGQRNAPTVLNALYDQTQFWDGRAKTLEYQAELPIVNPVEMGQPNIAAAVTRVASVGDYRRAFQKVFGREVNARDLLRALASYERALFSFDSPFDRFNAGDREAISASARRGWELFNGRGRCNKCHALSDRQPNLTGFTDNDFHNIGIGIIRHNVVALAQQAEKLVNSGDSVSIDRAAIQTQMTALGRYLITKKEADIASFKTPNLRNVLVTGPYFHDGSQETLWDVVDHYNKGDGLQNPYLDQDIQPLALRESEIDDLVAFLVSLTSKPYEAAGAKELERQHRLSLTQRPQRDTARALGPKPPAPDAGR
jgi:cytochrome c peroxidase